MIRKWSRITYAMGGDGHPSAFLVRFGDLMRIRPNDTPVPRADTANDKDYNNG